MRVRAGTESRTFLANEFISAILEDRQPAVNVWEAVAYTLPGVRRTSIGFTRRRTAED